MSPLRASPEPAASTLRSASFEASWNDLLEAASAGWWEIDLKTLAVVWSDETSRLFGADPATHQPTLDDWISRVHPEDQSGCHAAVKRLRGGEVDRIDREYRILWPDGSHRWIQVKGRVERSATNEPLRTRGILFDVTARKNSQLEAERSTKLLRAVIDAAEDAVFAKDETGRYLMLNDAAARIMGAKKEDVLGKTDLDFFPPQIAAQLRADDAGVMGGLRQDAFEETLFVDGVERTFLTKKTPFTAADGTVLGVVGVARDLTDRVADRLALEESERKFRSLAECLPDPVFVLDPLAQDPRLPIVYVSPAVRKTHGYDPAELVGKSILSALDAPSTAAAGEDRLERLLQGESLRFEGEHVAKDGRRIPIEVHSTLIQWEGRPAILGIDRDITYRQRIEAELRENVTRLEMGMRLGRVFTFEWRPESDRVVRSRNCAEILRLPESEAVQDTGERFFERLHPDDRERCLGIFRSLAPARPSYRTAYRMLAPDGDVIYLEETGLAEFDGQGALVRLYGMTADATERKRSEAALRDSEERLSQVAESMDQIFWVMSHRDGRVEFVSPAFEKIVGRSRSEFDSSPDAWRRLIVPEDRERVAQAFDAWFRNPVTEYRQEFRFLRADGQVRWMIDQAKAVRDEHGVVYRVTGMAEDVTERKAMEAQVADARRIDAIGRLAGGVAHDFNNLLTVVMGSGELLRAQIGRVDPRRELVESILEASSRAVALTRQLLAFGRRQPMERARVDLGEIVRAAEPMLARLVRNDVAFVVDIAPEPTPILADPTQIDQILLNLAINARDALAPGGRLTIAVDRVDVPEPRARLRVVDNGCGMSDEVKARMFEPFFTTKGASGGTGLGLSVVHGVVVQSGGSIEVRSEPGCGTVVEATFPMCSGSSPCVAPAEVVEFSGEPRSSVLLVDDDPNVRSTVRQVLESQGYRVIEAADGADAIALARSPDAVVDVLLTDLVMPGIGGREVAAAARAARPKLPIVFMSAHAADGLDRMLGDGSAFIQKPFSATSIAQALRRELANSGKANA